MFGLTPFNRRQCGTEKRITPYGVEDLFESFFNDSLFPSIFRENNGIRADIRETEKEYIIDAELPGVSKEDIKLDLKDDMLTIMVERDEQIKEEKENYIRRERRYGSYGRSFHVENVKHDGITAKYDSGILSITLPKNEDKGNNKRRIEIQ